MLVSEEQTLQKWFSPRVRSARQQCIVVDAGATRWRMASFETRQVYPVHQRICKAAGRICRRLAGHAWEKILYTHLHQKCMEIVVLAAVSDLR